MTRKTKIILLIALVSGGITYLTIKRVRGNKIYEQLMQNLKSGENKTGTAKDVKEGSVGWSSITYWASTNPSLKNNSAKYEKIADTLWSQIHNIFVSADSVYETIKQIKTQSEGSYVSYLYAKETEKLLNKIYDTQTLLQGIQGIDKDVSEQIVKYLNPLPAK